MLCELCASASRIRRAESPAEHHVVSKGPQASCDVCGRLIARSRDRVVEMIAQLARFGLTGQMLLSRRRS